MRIPGVDIFTGAACKGRDALLRLWLSLVARVRGPLPGRFQLYSHTLPDRYPWLFKFAAAHLGNLHDLSIMSFGCSSGEEVLALRNYFPAALIKGIDIDPRNIALSVKRTAKLPGVTFATAATTAGEPAESYDAIFCLAVLCHGDLTTGNAQRCDPLLRFGDFERIVTDFARCLKPGGLLLLHTANFRFCDTSISRDFDVVLEADPAQLAPDVLFGRDNRLMRGAKYCAVAFRTRAIAGQRT